MELKRDYKKEYEKEINKLIELLKIKFKNDEIQSPSFTKEQLDIMNLGINLYKHFDELFFDNEKENNKI